MATTTLTFEVEITDEDRLAGLNALTNQTGEVQGLPLEDHDMISLVLEPVLRRALHRNRCRLRWGKFRVYEALEPSVDGMTWARGTDENGEETYTQVPGKRRPIVDDPREGSWACEKSPTKLCWYDQQSDPCWDFCLFCGEPDERK